MYREILHHMKDQLYVKTSAVDKALQCLDTNGIVIIIGRKGTGKTTMCLELALSCGKEGFIPYLVDLTDTTEDFGCNTLYIIDEIQCDPINLFNKKMSRVIITCSDFEQSTLKSLLVKCNLYKKDHIVDLDDILSTEEKETILQSYMTANQIDETSAQESNYRDPKILTDDKMRVAVDHDTVKAIVRCEPMLGFPLTVVQFCEDRKKSFLGSKFFTDPPRSLVDEFKSMYDKAVSFKTNGTCSEAIDEYLMLTFIAIEPNKSLDINNFDIHRFDMLCFHLFHIKCQHTTNDIKQTANSLVGKYLKCKEDKYEFTHSCIPKAVFLSSDYFVKYIIENGSQSDILEFFRSFKYENVAEELVLYLKENKKDYYNILCDRLVPAAVKEVSLPKVIHRYIYEHFIRYHDDVFLHALFEYLESHYNRQMLPNIPISMSKNFLVTQLSKDKTNVESESSGSDSDVSPWEIMTLIEQLTNNGKDPWIFQSQSVPGFILLYGLVVACKNQYERKKKQNEKNEVKATLDTIMGRLVEKIEDKSIFRSLWQSFDNYGNTFFHYIMLYSEEVCCYILKYSDDLLLRKTENLVTIENNSKISPLHIAAYLGKYEIVTKLMEGAKPSEKAHVLTFVQIGAVREQSSQDKAEFLNFDHKVVHALEVATKESFSKLESSLKCKKNDFVPRE